MNHKATIIGNLLVCLTLGAPACDGNGNGDGNVNSNGAPARAEDTKESTVKKPQTEVIKIAMSAAFVSESGTPVYEKITDYLAKKAGLKVEFVTGLGYETINAMLESGDIDAGFICGLPYVLLRDEKQFVELLAAPVMKHPRYKNQPKYFSDLIVQNDSSFQSLEDLRGKTFVYNESISNSGYNLPRWHLIKKGFHEEPFFGTVKRSGSHEESIRMVAAGEADASFVDSLVLEYERDRGANHAGKVRVIESLGPAGIVPVVVSTKVPEDTRKRLKQALVHMHEDPKGRAILDEASVSHFTEVDDDNYQDVRDAYYGALEAGYTEIR